MSVYDPFGYLRVPAMGYASDHGTVREVVLATVRVVGRAECRAFAGPGLFGDARGPFGLLGTGALLASVLRRWRDRGIPPWRGRGMSL